MLLKFCVGLLKTPKIEVSCELIATLIHQTGLTHMCGPGHGSGKPIQDVSGKPIQDVLKSNTENELCSKILN